MARLVRGLLVTVVAFTLAFGALTIFTNDTEAAWTGYWTWDKVRWAWTWTWVWINETKGWTVS